MAKSLEQHKARQQALSLLGKDLARRANSKCELCDAKGVKLGIFEVAPIPDEPSLDHCILICGRCTEQIQKPKLRNSDHWRCLGTAVWSETLPVQVQAIIMLEQLLAHDWAIDLKEMLYIPPETETRLALL